MRFFCPREKKIVFDGITWCLWKISANWLWLLSVKLWCCNNLIVLTLLFKNFIELTLKKKWGKVEVSHNSKMMPKKIQFHDPAVTSTIVYADCGEKEKANCVQWNFHWKICRHAVLYVFWYFKRIFWMLHKHLILYHTHKNATHICENIYLRIYDMFVACFLWKTLQIFHFDENSFLPLHSSCAFILAWHKTYEKSIWAKRKENNFYGGNSLKFMNFYAFVFYHLACFTL